MVDMITGGSGYIGNNLKELLDNPLIYDLKNGDDIRNGPEFLNSLIDVDTCYHLAAWSGIQICEKNPSAAFAINVKGTLNIMLACGISNIPVVFASSMAAENPINVYGLTKRLAEDIVLFYGGIVTRIANVYGGRRYTELKCSAVARLMKGTWEERGHGAEKRDFIHVEQVCKKLIEASTLPKKSLINICTGHKRTIDDLIKLSKSSQFPDNIQFSEGMK